MSENKPDTEKTGATLPESPLMAHLFELRTRLMRATLGVLIVFLALFPFANQIYTWLSGPLTVHMPEGSTMIAIEVASPFLIPFKLVLLAAVVIAIPWILYQAWGFVAPGLYRNERRLTLPLVISSTLLFYLGIAFAYFVVFPLMFSFFIGTTPQGVAVMTDIGRYLDFVSMLFLAFGFAFEVPVATVLLVAMGATTPKNLAANRPYIIVGSFVIGMLLTPPDLISQALLAVPMCILFELGLFFSRHFVPESAQTDEDESPADDATDERK